METQKLLNKSNGFWDKKFWDAVVTKCGRGVEILCEQKVREDLKKFVDDLVLKIQFDGSSSEPLVNNTRETDITCEEFCNLGDKQQLEAIPRDESNAAVCANYRFRFNEGISFGHKENFCAQVVNLIMTGGEMKVGEKINRADNQSSFYHYSHKEKITVPSRRKVEATMKTSLKEFYQNYSLKFKMKKSKIIQFTYLTKCQQRCKKFLSCCRCFCCCCCCTRPSKGEISAEELLKSLPNFKTDDGYCYFTVDGTLTWISEVYSVEVNENAIL